MPLHAHRDLALLYVGGLLRSLCTGLVAVLLGVYLFRIGYSTVGIGAATAVGLAGSAVAIFVVTLRCDHSCHYCQVSRQTEDRVNFDMTRSHADKALEFAFRGPSPNIKST